MKKIWWDPEKSFFSNNPNRVLSLGIIAERIQSGSVIVIEKRNKYPNQMCFAVLIEGDIWCAPFREEDESVFLITAWPDRKLKKKYKNVEHIKTIRTT